MKHLLFAIILLFPALTMNALTAPSKEKDTNKENTFKLLEGKQYMFIAESFSSQKGYTSTVNSYYHLTVNGDSATAYLPFFGRAYSSSMVGEGGIEFDNEMIEYTSELKVKRKEKNNQTQIYIEIKGELDTYRCHLSVSSNGFTSLSVSSNNKQGMSFNGRIKAIEVEK